MKILNRFSNRILISYSLLLSLLVLVMFGFFNEIIYNTHLDIIKREMLEKLSLIDLNIKRLNLKYPDDELLIADESNVIADIIGLRVTLVDFSGKVFADSEVKDVSKMDNHLQREEISAAMNSRKSYSIRHSSSVNTEMLYYVKKSDNFLIRVAKPLDEIHIGLDKNRKVVMIFLICTASIGIMIVMIIARRMTRPIIETRKFAEKFASGHFDSRILNYRDDEIGSVQRALNKLANTVVDKMTLLASEKLKLSTALETIPDGIALIRAGRTVEFANRSFMKIFGIEKPVKGQFFYEVIRSRSINEKIEEAIIKREPLSFERESNGGIFEIFITPVEDSSSKPPLLIVMHDITEKKRIDRIKSDLVGNVSHELKTPVTIIKGYLETISKQLDDKDLVKQLIARAIENADRQNALINDILKLNRIETAFEFIQEDIELVEIIRECEKIIKTKAAAKKVEIVFKEHEPAIIEKANRFLAEEIFFNIIDNAVNYNHQGGKVVIELNNDKENMVCSITDTGTGIPAESLDRIFERFYRVDKSRSRSTGGTGLGLSIVRHAAELLGWRVTATSSDEGSRFNIIIITKHEQAEK